jgi:hypothetical protein
MKNPNLLLVVWALMAFGLSGCASSSSATNNGGSSSNIAELQGDYAFTFNGITGGPGYGVVFAAVGRFTADGNGNLTNGEVDTNGIGTGAVLSAQPFTGTYTIGADHRGVMTLDIPGGARLAFAMKADGNAQFIEIDAAGGTGTIGSGSIEKADTTAYSSAKIIGDYAFGVAGMDANNNRAAFVGRFTSNGAGVFTDGAADANDSAGSYPASIVTENYTVTDTTAGRGSISLAMVVGLAQRNLNFVFYIVNGDKLFAMRSDAVNSSSPLLNGVVFRQQIPSGGFSNVSLNGASVIYLTGLSVCGSAPGPAPNVFIGLLAADGNGGVNLTFDQNCGGVATAGIGEVGTYNVASNGRTSILAGGAAAIAYLSDVNTLFLMGTDSSVLFGPGEPQSATLFANNQLNGAYAGLASSPAAFGVTEFSGEFSADGASPNGLMTGAEDIGTSGGTQSGVAFTAKYSLPSSATNGRGSMTVKSGSGGNAIVYMISPAKFVAVSSDDASPAVMIFERAP